MNIIKKKKVLQGKTQEPITKHWFLYKKHTNQRKSNGFNVKSIGTNEKAKALM